MSHPVSERRRLIAWALYDWGNSAFAVTVMTAFFPVFFKQYWSAGIPATQSTFYLGLANSASSLAIVVTAPILGAIADRAGARKRFLMYFALLGIATTVGLFFVQQGQWQMAMVLYGAAAFGFAGANVFYDSLLPALVSERRLDWASALGYGLGYLGSGLLFGFCVWLTVQPQTFGLADAPQAIRLSFLLVAGWWLLFSLPLLLWVREPAGPVAKGRRIGAGIDQLRETFRHIKQLRVVAVFLLAYWLYIDGVDTVVRMATDYGLSLGFGVSDLMLAVLMTQFIGFPSALLFGYLGQRVGAKRGILICIVVYVAVIGWARGMQEVWEFYFLAAVIGLVQGGIQALSRSLYARIIPRDKSAEFFGFYNMLGKFAAVLGPALMGVVAVLSGDTRLALLSTVVLFVLGAVLLLRVDVERGKAMALALESTPRRG